MSWLVVASLLLAGARADELQIRESLSPLNAQRPVREETRFVILHTTEGGDESAQRLVKRRGLANYLVLRDGRVIRIIDEKREARHAGLSRWNGTEGLDQVSVGVEVVGYHHRPITRAQEASLKKLVDQLKATWDLSDEAVLPHAMVAYGRPNRWHDEEHRGRKRCGMQFARDDLRERIGVTSRPPHDPDVRAGDLIEADPFLAAALWGARIDRGQTAAQVAGVAYRARSTVYVLPGGRRLRGDQIRNWTTIPAGTWVLLNQGG